jgi:glycosyltransferase involved in cell wall biosynthesis
MLALGYLRDYKGTDLAIQAVAEITAAGHPVELTVAGEPWDGDAARWIDLVADLGLTDQVDLRLEYQADASVAELIASHHCLVAPYRSATQSGVVAQALAAGRPVVATRVGGLPDVVVEGKNGTLAEPNNVADLAAAIRRLEANLQSLAAGAAQTSASWADVATALIGRW